MGQGRAGEQAGRQGWRACWDTPWGRQDELQPGPALPAQAEAEAEAHWSPQRPHPVSSQTRRVPQVQDPAGAAVQEVLLPGQRLQGDEEVLPDGLQLDLCARR